MDSEKLDRISLERLIQNILTTGMLKKGSLQLVFRAGAAFNNPILYLFRDNEAACKYPSGDFTSAMEATIIRRMEIEERVILSLLGQRFLNHTPLGRQRRLSTEFEKRLASILLSSADKLVENAEVTVNCLEPNYNMSGLVGFTMEIRQQEAK